MNPYTLYIRLLYVDYLGFSGVGYATADATGFSEYLLPEILTLY